MVLMKLWAEGIAQRAVGGVVVHKTSTTSTVTESVIV